MSEARDDTGDTQSSGGPAESPGAPAARSFRGVAAALAVALLLVAAMAASAPFWAPALPWARPPPVREAAPDPRLDQLTAALRQSQQDQAAAVSALQQIDKRVAALEAKPPPPVVDLGDLRQQLARLSADSADAATRIDALDKAARRQEQAGGDLAARLDALEKATQTQVAERTNAALALVLLQIRDALVTGRPFEAEYGSLLRLARGDREVMAAAEPLAEPAKTGVASASVLADRLRQLKVATAAHAASPGEPENSDESWTRQAMQRLGGLVQVRRIDGPDLSPPDDHRDTAVDEAQRMLAGGDLDRAVAAMQRLDGAAADAARPWVQMAKQRLAVDVALHRLQTVVAARLGGVGDAPGTTR